VKVILLGEHVRLAATEINRNSCEDCQTEVAILVQKSYLI